MMEGAVVVTGAAGSLGQALCLEFCAQGRRVAGLGQSPADLDAVAARAGQLFVGSVCDVVDPEAVRRAFREVRAKIGPVDVLINNATQYPRRDILDETAETFMETVAANLGGPVACTREALSDMVERGEGRILNIGSFADLDPLPASSAYAASRGALRVFSKALVADLAHRFPRIVITDWMPGALATRTGTPEAWDPAVAARWGVMLASMRDPSLNGTVWDRDREILPPIPRSRRLVQLLLGRRQVARQLQSLAVEAEL